MCAGARVFSDVRCYATPNSLDSPGPVQLRPWMLNFHAQFGLRGYIEPDTALARRTRSNWHEVDTLFLLLSVQLLRTWPKCCVSLLYHPSGFIYIFEYNRCLVCCSAWSFSCNITQLRTLAIKVCYKRRRTRCREDCDLQGQHRAFDRTDPRSLHSTDRGA